MPVAAGAGITAASGQRESAVVVHDAKVMDMVATGIERWPMQFAGAGGLLLMLALAWLSRLRRHPKRDQDPELPPSRGPSSAWPAAVASRPSVQAVGSFPSAGPASTSQRMPNAPPATKQDTPAARPIHPPLPRPQVSEPDSKPALALALAPPLAPAPPSVAPPTAPKLAALDAVRSRIRDRFLHAQFDGAVNGVTALGQAAHVVRVARQYFEQGNNIRAVELLDASIQLHPGLRPVHLALLEILFLVRDAARFEAEAVRFQSVYANAAEWAEICRLGRHLNPSASRFLTPDTRSRDDEFYGPWPDLPNWIQAPWDLTAEVLAAEFHQLMHQLQPRPAAEASVPLPLAA